MCSGGCGGGVSRVFGCFPPFSSIRSAPIVTGPWRKYSRSAVQVFAQVFVGRQAESIRREYLGRYLAHGPWFKSRKLSRFLQLIPRPGRGSARPGRGSARPRSTAAVAIPSRIGPGGSALADRSARSRGAAHGARCVCRVHGRPVARAPGQIHRGPSAPSRTLRFGVYV